MHSPSIIGRVDNDILLLDPRTVLPEEDETVLESFFLNMGEFSRQQAHRTLFYKPDITFDVWLSDVEVLGWVRRKS